MCLLKVCSYGALQRTEADKQALEGRLPINLVGNNACWYTDMTGSGECRSRDIAAVTEPISRQRNGFAHV